MRDVGTARPEVDDVAQVAGGRLRANWPSRRIATGVLGVAIALWCTGTAWASGGYVVVANQPAGTPPLSRAELKAMLVGASREWKSGTLVQLVLPDGASAPLEAMSGDVFGFPANVVRAKIKQQVFAGNLRLPTIVSTEAEMVDAIAKKPGALGVVSVEASAHLPPGVVLVTPSN